MQRRVASSTSPVSTIAAVMSANDSSSIIGMRFACTSCIARK